MILTGILKEYIKGGGVLIVNTVEHVFSDECLLKNTCLTVGHTISITYNFLFSLNGGKWYVYNIEEPNDKP